MTLLNAAPYDEKKENNRIKLWIAAGVLILLTAVTGVGGFLLGHGWFFTNMKAEFRVNAFMNTVESGDYGRAYAIWMADPDWPQHPQKYKDYPFEKFKEDWTTASDYGPIKSHHVDISKRTPEGDGIIVAVRINGSSQPLFIHYQRTNGTLSYSPAEIRY
jgi:hypothetical protein